MSAKPPYLPPGQLPGASVKSRPGAKPLFRQWRTVFVTMLVTTFVALGLSLLLNPPRTVEVQLTALAAATMTAVYTPPPSPTPTPVDTDADTIPDSRDNCILVSNPQQEDVDDDTIGDPCDNDADGDGIPLDKDNCPLIADMNRIDSDGDGEGDRCDADDDGDTVPDAVDNCPMVSNPDRSDMDGDALGDMCDTAFDLSGLTLSVEGSQAVFVGSTSSEVLLNVRHNAGVEPAAGAALQWMTTAGTFRAAEQTCADSGAGQYILPAAGNVRFCPPDVLTPVTITVREINTAGHPAGSGGQLTLDTRQDSLTLAIQPAGILNRVTEPDNESLSRCYLDEDSTGIDLEEEAIPLLFTLQTATPNDTGRSYVVRLRASSGALYIVRNNDCMPVIGKPIAGSGEFVAAINLPYTLFFVPQAALQDMNLYLSVLDSDLEFTVPPLMRAIRPLRLRFSNGEAAARLENGERAVLTGISPDNAWLRVRVENDDRDMWLNNSLEPISAAILGATFDIEQVDPPTYAGTGD